MVYIVLAFMMYSYFSAFITMNLFGQTTNVWIGLQNDDYERWLNGKPVVYSNWSPFETINVSFKIYFLEIGKRFYSRLIY